MLLKIFTSIAYILMIYVNYLANALPIGGVTTGAASDAYGNLFTPAGITFSIWGIIYLFLFIYIVYQFGSYEKNSNSRKEILFSKINPYFLASSVINISWIFAWHYNIIWLSVVLMIVFLFIMIKIANIINKEKFSFVETFCVRIPFSIYFGWITIAAIANITVFLVSIAWDGFGVSEAFWTVIILLVGAFIGVMRMKKDKNIYYGLVMIWAYAGILLKHISTNGFSGEYKNIIMTTIFCIIVFFISIGIVSYTQLHSKNS